MREIKFRAWVGGKVGNINFGDNYRMEHSVTLFDGAYASFVGGCEIYGGHPEIPLMQYTGLKDKNGKEIYEGDIVDYTGSEIPGDEHNYCQVEWLDNTGWGLVEYGMHLPEFYTEEIEVIGNIYEHGHLLNNTK